MPFSYYFTNGRIFISLLKIRTENIKKSSKKFRRRLFDVKFNNKSPLFFRSGYSWWEISIYRQNNERRVFASFLSCSHWYRNWLKFLREFENSFIISLIEGEMKLNKFDVQIARIRFIQGWAVVPGFGGIPVSVPQIPGIGTGTGTQSRGTVGTGTNICGTVPLLKSRGTTNPGISGQESRSVPGRSRCPGILRDTNPTRSREAIYFFYQE